MRTYRACWLVLVSVVTGVSLALGWLQEGPGVVLAEVVAAGVLGLAFGVGWEEDRSRRWGVGRVWAVRGIVAALVLVGLPHLVGPWALLVVLTLGLLSPAAVLVTMRWSRACRRAAVAGHLSGLGDAELARRWQSTAHDVRSSWRTPAEVLVVVVERQRLLDEIERRDPERFTRWLVAAGWRESPQG